MTSTKEEIKTQQDENQQEVLIDSSSDPGEAETSDDEVEEVLSKKNEVFVLWRKARKHRFFYHFAGLKTGENDARNAKNANPESQLAKGCILRIETSNAKHLKRLAESFLPDLVSFKRSKVTLYKREGETYRAALKRLKEALMELEAIMDHQLEIFEKISKFKKFMV
mmetsp:Transcript_76831/g.89266  ORF Transcript_76831/g.89266 Transcript_76831/m.89266 type:complete len:167 (-) Transcript_76831:76-576(-)|eukprot:CAMPEP_0176447422 /NCGR_PEP_ID=MMETSP0127-20121128/25017_1 /TAXON_ID=938130 /ORGANISM="Platyophrya macrostoma, Strain WH" /LENGTH=166 /DNA_ID=CAMNT_0017833855 /DNA_START=38 /DNA_END=538 /DNA_ORIENTATION=+